MARRRERALYRPGPNHIKMLLKLFWLYLGYSRDGLDLPYDLSIWRRLVTFIEKYLDGPLPAPSTGRLVQPFKKTRVKKGIFRHLEQVSLIAMSNRVETRIASGDILS